ncbi:uncharacterized protein [Symphalangus syndactylus]|uniref:uncharacterized protein n=1 Tax=Symphalangus syndactylus TaxID=9590 RepID=UPI003005D5AD
MESVSLAGTSRPRMDRGISGPLSPWQSTQPEPNLRTSQQPFNTGQIETWDPLPTILLDTDRCFGLCDPRFLNIISEPSLPIKTPDSARLGQTSILPTVGRSYPLQVSFTPQDDLPTERSYPLWVFFLLRAGHSSGRPACRKDPLWVSSELFCCSIKLFSFLLTLQLSAYLILPGHRTRTWDPPNGGTERGITQIGLKCPALLSTLRVTRREELQPFRKPRPRSSPTPQTPCLGLCGSWCLQASGCHHVLLVQIWVPTMEATCGTCDLASPLHGAGAYAGAWSCLPHHSSQHAWLGTVAGGHIHSLTHPLLLHA